MVKPLKYDARLSLKEAEGVLQEVRDEFAKVKENYSGFFGRLKKNMKEKDQRTLHECIGVVLMPLEQEEAVQEQLSKARNLEDTIGYQAIMLKDEIRNYMSGFKNTDMMKAGSGKVIG